MDAFDQMTCMVTSDVLPLPFLIFINNVKLVIPEKIEISIQLTTCIFTCLVYRSIKSEQDHTALQQDLIMLQI